MEKGMQTKTLMFVGGAIKQILMTIPYFSGFHSMTSATSTEMLLMSAIPHVSGAFISVMHLSKLTP